MAAGVGEDAPGRDAAVSLRQIKGDGLRQGKKREKSAGGARRTEKPTVDTMRP
jgi:hypothetical protein